MYLQFCQLQRPLWYGSLMAIDVEFRWQHVSLALATACFYWVQSDGSRNLCGSLLKLIGMVRPYIKFVLLDKLCKVDLFTLLPCMGTLLHMFGRMIKEQYIPQGYLYILTVCRKLWFSRFESQTYTYSWDSWTYKCRNTAKTQS